MNQVSEGLKKSKTFWTTALVEPGDRQDTGGCKPPKPEMPYYYL